MKHLFYFLFLVGVTVSCLPTKAQERDKLRLRAYYMATFKAYEEGTHIGKEEKVLDIGQYERQFYGRWQRARQEIVDSLSERGGGLKEALSLVGNYPSPREFYAVYKNYPRRGTLTYTNNILKNFVYEEGIEAQEWHLLPKDTVILDYACRYAECDFRGRKWQAWYTEEIPINEGPWKLSGLPGLILYAVEESGVFSFECIGLQEGHGEPMKIPRMKKYIRCSRAELMQLEREFGQDPLAFDKKTGGTGVAYDAQGKPMKYEPKTPLFLDY